MNIAELAADIHLNAKEHGWWETERPFDEVMALIHSEWSEALEEERMGRPMEYRMCWMESEEPAVCDPAVIERCQRPDRPIECKYRMKKPEGVAVELIDGVIRIFDFLEGCGYVQDCINRGEDWPAVELEEYADFNHLCQVNTLPGVVASLHNLTSKAYQHEELEFLELAARTAMAWVKQHGEDPAEILLMKHGYNKGRPYKHGKKF